MSIFETARLIVREWDARSSDVDRVFDIYSRDEVARWLGSVPKPLESYEQAADVIRRWAGRADAVSGCGVWAVEVRSSREVAGTVLLVPLPGETGEVEVGWHFHPDSWGNGYATEAARGAIRHGFAHGHDEIFAVVRPANEPSLKVCRRLGMTPLGLTSRWYDAELEAFRTTPAEFGGE